MSWQAAAALGVVVIAAFADSPDQRRPRVPATVDAGRPFTLSPGGRAKLRGDPLEIALTRVVSDSRCPKGARCLVAGEAVLAITVSDNGVKSAHELRTDPAASAGVRQGRYTITLENLEPQPELGRQTPPSRYVATFVVHRN